MTTITDIISKTQPGSWVELPDTKMSAVFPPKEGHPAWGTEGPESIISDWCGAAYDTENEAFTTTGGGHTNYGGNELYRFLLEAIKWERMTDPSPMIPDASKGGDPYYVTTDGSRVSSHTYDGLEYIPSLKSLFLFGGSQYRSGNPSDQNAYLVNLDTKTWSRKAKAPQAVLEIATAWDSKRNRVLCVYKTGLLSYDPTKDTWAKVTDGWWYQSNCTAAYSPDHDIFLLLSSESHTGISYIDFNKSSTLQKAPVNGATCPHFRTGVVYCPDVKKFVCWNGDATVWTIDPVTWVVTQIDPATGPTFKDASGNPKNTGVYSKWQYSSKYKVFIGYNSSDDNVWLYKLSIDGSTSPTPPPSDTTTPPPSSDNGSTTPPPPITGGTPVSATYNIGPKRKYTKPSQVAGLINDGDTVVVDAGTYDDGCVWPKSVTIKAADPANPPIIGNYVAEGKGVFVTQGSSTILENIHLWKGLGGNSNAAAIRHEGKSLILHSCEIENCHNGILTNHIADASLEIYNTHFHHMNTVGDLAHNIYNGKNSRLIVEGCLFEDGQSGHFIKSLSAYTTIRYNRIIQVNDLDAALIDLWGDQTFEVIGNAMKRPGTYGAMGFIQITYRLNNGVPEAEIPGRVKKGLVAYNTAFFDNASHDDPRWSSLIHYNYPMPNLTVKNNVGIHLNQLIMDDHNYGFAKNGGVSENNYWTKNYTPEVFDNLDLLTLKKSLMVAVPIDYSVDSEPTTPIGKSLRTEVTAVGAYEVDSDSTTAPSDPNPPVDGGTTPPPDTTTTPTVLQPGSYTLSSGTYIFDVK